MKSHFGFAKLVVQDLDGTAAFYRDVAQLEELMRVEDEIGGRAIEEVLFKPTAEGGATFVLFKFLDRDLPANEEVIVGFQTPDVIAFVERARRAGASVVVDVEEKAAHGVKVAFLKDPEGHLIEVVELL